MATRTEIMATSDYEPYDHREREGQTNRLETLVHIIKGIIGTGIMALPEAFKNAGYLVGTVGTVIITLIIAYCLQLLFVSRYFLCKRDKIPVITYPEALRQGFLMGPSCLNGWAADFIPSVVNGFIVFYQLGVLCIYTIFSASNIKQVVDVNTDVDSHLTIEIYIIMLIIPLLLVTYIKNLKLLAPFMNLANWVTLAALLCMYYFFFTDMDSLTDRDMFASISTFPLYMGTVMFAMLSIGAFLSIELNMKNGKYFIGTCGTLNQGLIICTIITLFTGFFGYWKYGDEAEGSVTLNIDVNNPVAQAIRICYAVAIFFSYPLNAYPITEILWEQYFIKYMETSEYQLFWEYLMRSTIVFLSFLFAIFIPRLGLFISLFGAFCLSVLGIILPPLLDLCTHWPNDLGPKNVVVIRDILLMAFGVIGWASGTYSSVRGIIESFQEDDE